METRLWQSRRRVSDLAGGTSLQGGAPNALTRHQANTTVVSFATSQMNQLTADFAAVQPAFRSAKTRVRRAETEAA